MKRVLVFLLVLSLAAAKTFEGNCFEIKLPGIVQVKRGETESFGITLTNILGSEKIDDVKLNYTGEFLEEDGEIELPEIRSVLWEESGTARISVPHSAERGYRNVIILVSSEDCSDEHGSFLLQILRGDELSLSLEPEEAEMEKGSLKVITLAVENRGPEPLNITLDQSGVAMASLEFKPRKMELGAETEREAFVTLNTTKLNFQEHVLNFRVTADDVEGLNASAQSKITVKPSTIAEQRRQEKLKELSALRKSLEMADVPEEAEMEMEEMINEATRSLEEQNLTRAEELLAELRSLEEAGWWEEPPQETAPQETAPSLLQELSEKSWAEIKWELGSWLHVINIAIVAGVVILFIHVKLAKAVEVVKSVVRYEEGRSKVRVTVVNHSPLPLYSLTLRERLPPDSALDSTFKVDGEEKRFEKEGPLYSVELGKLGGGGEMKVEYWLAEREKRKRMEFPPADMEFKFLRRFKIRSNEPIA